MLLHRNLGKLLKILQIKKLMFKGKNFKNSGYFSKVLTFADSQLFCLSRKINNYNGKI